MVQDAQGSKAPIQRVVDAFACYFVWAVMILAPARLGGVVRTWGPGATFDLRHHLVFVPII